MSHRRPQVTLCVRPTEVAGRSMGFRRNTNLGCHTCKRRYVGKGHKRGGSWDEAECLGWTLMIRSTLGDWIWLCPTCARKHAATKLPLDAPRKKRR
jgi:hypothetical protein